MKASFKRTIQIVTEDKPGQRWQNLYRQFEPNYLHWFLKEGIGARPPYLVSRRNLVHVMPELEPLYDQLVKLAGDTDHAARLLALYNPTPYISGCSQLAWLEGEPFLIRNYDYNPNWWEGVILQTKWNGKYVLGMSDCLWGLLDGINEDGLVVSLTFGGRKVVGDGFGIPLILRYVLETCSTTEEAVKELKNIPAHMAYNVTVLDDDGIAETVFMRPDKPVKSQRLPYSTNHQDEDTWLQYTEATKSYDREQELLYCLSNLDLEANDLVERFLNEPLFARKYKRGFGTLYTSIYWPLRKQAEFFWPTKSVRLNLGEEVQKEIKVSYYEEKVKPKSVADLVPHIPLEH